MALSGQAPLYLVLPVKTQGSRMVMRAQRTDSLENGNLQ
jgi:hypothetical protein